nr:MAG: VP1 protein [Solemoviridae sp. 1]
MKTIMQYFTNAAFRAHPAIGVGVGVLGGLLSNVVVDLFGKSAAKTAVVPSGVGTELAEHVVGKKTMIAGASAAIISAVAVYYWRRTIYRRTQEYVMKLKENFGCLKEVMSNISSPFTMESLVAGSREAAMALPKYQLKVGNIEGGQFNVFGSAVRVFDSIVMPAHVLQSALVDGFVYVKGSQGAVALKEEDFEVLDTDLTAIHLKEKQLSMIGAPIASIWERINEVRGEFVSIVGVQGQGTVGALVHDPSCFGKVLYKGTTLKGYSGALYAVGKQIAGMHAWGGQANGGYSMSYIKVKVVAMQKLQTEDTEDFLHGLFRNKKLKRENVRFVGGDLVEFRENGMYHRVDIDVWKRAVGSEELPPSYEDYELTQMEPESLMNSGELKNLNQPGGSGSSAGPGQAISSSVSNSIETLSKLLLEETQNQLRKKLNKNKPKASTTEPQPSTSGLLAAPKQN